MHRDLLVVLQGIERRGTGPAAGHVLAVELVVFPVLLLAVLGAVANLLAPGTGRKIGTVGGGFGVLAVWIVALARYRLRLIRLVHHFGVGLPLGM